MYKTNKLNNEYSYSLRPFFPAFINIIKIIVSKINLTNNPSFTLKI